MSASHAADAAEPEPLSDEALAGAFGQQGNEAAFDLLVRRWRDRIVDFAEMVTADRALAEDVGQEVFLRLYRNPQAYDPTRPFRNWIYTVARNLCFDGRRRRKTRTHHTRKAGERGRLQPGAAPDPVAGAAHSEAQAALRQAVAQLPEPFRDAYVLCAVRGLSYEEAGEICGCGAKTLSTRLARARKRLVERMKRWL